MKRSKDFARRQGMCGRSRLSSCMHQIACPHSPKPLSAISKEFGKWRRIDGFVAAGHIVTQIARDQEQTVYVFTRAGDRDAQQLALSLGAAWAGASDDRPPGELDAAIIYAPVGGFVPLGLRAVRKGDRVVCVGIHMSDIPALPIKFSGVNAKSLRLHLTRKDGIHFLAAAAKAEIQTHTTAFALMEANEALDRLRDGRLVGAAVLCS
ncbi:hypothetical protein JQ589_32275 [Bradyrhizobium japonicum]|nr:hypothetical protein [Bradyrhizobium japonicum]